jgi:predicted glycogen debranching enzyme
MAGFGRETLGNLNEATTLEWLVTNGIGGFASSTIVGLNTRRYHGLLVASRRPPTERIVIVSRFEETLVCDGEEIPLSTNCFKKALAPDGFRHLESFESEPIPTWVFQYKDVLVVKSLCMVQGQNTTVVTYKAINHGRKIGLKIRPHFLFRDFHGNMFENAGFEDNTEISERSFKLQPFHNAPTAYMAWDRGTFVPEGYWYLENFLEEEAVRGLNPLEDDYTNGYLHIPEFSGMLAVLVSDAPIEPCNAMELRRREKQRIEQIAGSMHSEDPLLRKLLVAADQFIVDRRSTGGKSIIAGYPWFSDWGRDSLIALPGLTLVTGRFDDARSILKTFARSIRYGLVPNCFADQGIDAMYNAVDASLWYFFAVYKFIEYTDDYEFVREHLLDGMNAVIEAFQNGTIYHIHMDPEDGLISAGESGVQLTWMDAKVEDLVVTPRHGKAVEVNALWYNALKIHEFLLEKFQGDARTVGALARKVKTSFKKKFTNADKQCLYDCISPDGTIDDSVRPNQIFAVYLPFSMLDQQQEKAIIDLVFRELYTSLGLRSLSPKDPRYCGIYKGDRKNRDMAYHQGTVWGYLTGFFITAFLKVHHESVEAHLRASHMIEPFLTHIDRNGCVGSVSEIFDGNPPHQSKGCFAQAWSVAELLRCYVEDIKGQKPLLMI